MFFRYLQPSFSVLEVYQGFFFTMWFKSFDVMLVCYSLYWNPFHIHALPLYAWTVTLMVSVILQLCPAVVFYSPSDCLLLLSSLVHSCPLVMYHTVWFGTPIRLVSVTVWLIILYWYWLLFSPSHWVNATSGINARHLLNSFVQQFNNTADQESAGQLIVQLLLMVLNEEDCVLKGLWFLCNSPKTEVNAIKLK